MAVGYFEDSFTGMVHLAKTFDIAFGAVKKPTQKPLLRKPVESKTSLIIHHNQGSWWHLSV